MRELYLYHGTSSVNKKDIEKRGLRTGRPSNWEEMFTEGAIYLAVNPYVAEDYVCASPKYNGEDIIIYQVALSELNEQNIYYDWNNRCEYHTDINSIAYRGNILPKHLIQWIPSKQGIDETQTIEDFDGTLLYERVMSTFYEEVETNLENTEQDSTEKSNDDETHTVVQKKEGSKRSRVR